MEDTKFLGLRTVIYKVDDLKKAKKWYAKILNTEPYFDEPFYIGFDVGGYELGLMPIEGEQKKTPQTAVTYWGVEDIKASYQRLLELGATAHEAPENVGGEVMVATVIDPWGNEFGVIYNPHFKVKS